jgi:hypothetical protein
VDYTGKGQELEDAGIGQRVEYAIGKELQYEVGGQEVNIIIGKCKEEIRYTTRK